MVTWDAFGSLMDCIDIPNSATPAANAYLSGKRGKCTTIDEFEPARTRFSCTWRNIDFSFFAPDTRELNMDFTCSRYGSPFFGFAGFGPGSCAIGVTYRRLDQFGVNLNFNEGHSASTIGGRARCPAIFGPLTDEELENFNASRLLRKRR